MFAALLFASNAQAGTWLFATFDTADTQHTLSVRVLTDETFERPVLIYKPDGFRPAERTGEVHHIAHSEYSVLQFSLRGLLPSTLYRVRVKEDGAFRSAVDSVSTLGQNVDRVIAGGDLSVSPRAAKMWRMVRRQHPDVVVLGGDLAYGNGRSSAGPVWVRFLTQLRQGARRQDGSLAPVIAAIGNHETRLGESPFYLPLFGPPSGATYFSRQLGKDRLIILDTGHIAPYDGQLSFLKNALARPARFHIASYHIPLYPSHRSFLLADARRGRRAWGPLFAAHLDVALENHDHALKRTTVGRTFFLGDGAFGVTPRPTTPRDYLAMSASENHVWLLEPNYSPSFMRARALAVKGTTLDEIFIPVPKAKALVPTHQR